MNPPNDRLKPGDPGSFEGLEMRPRPTGDSRRTLVCPRCLGRGAWRTSSVPYGPRGQFLPTMGCSQCWGWGWVDPATDGECVHEFDDSKVLGNCLREWRCTKCGRTRVVDSSD